MEVALTIGHPELVWKRIEWQSHVETGEEKQHPTSLQPKKQANDYIHVNRDTYEADPSLFYNDINRQQLLLA